MEVTARALSQMRKLLQDVCVPSEDHVAVQVALTELFPPNLLEAGFLSTLIEQFEMSSDAAQWYWDAYVFAFRTCEFLEKLGIPERVNNVEDEDEE